MNRPTLLVLIALGCLAMALPTLWTTTAEANCARPVTYATHATEDGYVIICPVSFQPRGCEHDDVLLREDTESGEVKRITTCADPDEDYDDLPMSWMGSVSEHCFIDECVDEGDYRYGMKEPLDCEGASCSTDYFSPQSVDEDKSCSGDTTAAAHDGDTPWDGDDRQVCRYGDGTADPPSRTIIR